jgi:hypothetical protein
MSLIKIPLPSDTSDKSPLRKVPISLAYADKNENKIFLIYKEIQSEAVAKS